MTTPSGPEPLELLGAPGSPYTRKMLALLRYRRLPYAIHWGSHRGPRAGYPEPKVKLLPTVYFRTPEGGLEAMVDSTPIIRRLEQAHAARAAVPDDPVLAFFNAVLEDFGDEWLTKAMFHYRWAHAADAAHAGPQLIYWAEPTIAPDAAAAAAAFITQRQVDRLYVVGSNAVTAPTIEESYLRILVALDGVIQRQGYVLGARPASADFALYGQLTQLAVVEPTAAALCDQIAPRVRAWIDRVEDLSGLEPRANDWTPREGLRAALEPLLEEVGRVYAPFLRANAQAVATGAPSFETVIDGRPWAQPTFPYQARCLQWLREEHAALSPADRAVAAAVMEGTGLEALFA
ncbi:MAG: glutathione S-transferase N-terminal domain-containing protein [Hyphomonadaceae bacterium]|nr:glutathione S-transferase N-terminal domain-containing protein [Hyphomonadaceae bacterium]